MAGRRAWLIKGLSLSRLFSKTKINVLRLHTYYLRCFSFCNKFASVCNFDASIGHHESSGSCLPRMAEEHAVSCLTLLSKVIGSNWIFGRNFPAGCVRLVWKIFSRSKFWILSDCIVNCREYTGGFAANLQRRIWYHLACCTVSLRYYRRPYKLLKKIVKKLV